ncbi:hypothetical protein SESBI_03886 [Sesbania bispinosa]|nr:hypothetical protein SESBI_03886 [Sesbania bispinosa]
MDGDKVHRAPELVEFYQSLMKREAKKYTSSLLVSSTRGPKLRKWYGAPDLHPKDGNAIQDEEDDYPEDEVRDAVLITDGDSEKGQVCLPFLFPLFPVFELCHH